MDFKKLSTRFRQFGGFRLLWEYAKLGVLWTGVKAFFRCLVKRESFKAIYPEILKKVEPFLEQKYAPVVHEFKSSRVQDQELENSRINSTNTDSTNHTDRYIWFCWLQGLNEAPEIVRVCYHSLMEHLVKVKGYRLEVIDGKNWRQFIELPDYVVRKWEKGRIPAANFCDLLRLELLIRYGGTWIDSTVLCTGFGTQKSQIAQKEGVNTNLTNNTKQTANNQELENDKVSSLSNTDGTDLTDEVRAYLEAPLFLFQYTPEGTTAGISIGNWFITACTNNEVLMVLRDMLYAYWKDYNCTLDYYMFHLFFSMIAKEYPEQMAAMPYGYAGRHIALMQHWNETFWQEQWDRFTSKVCFHKLSYRVAEEVRNNKGNYYNYILNTESHDRN